MTPTLVLMTPTLVLMTPTLVLMIPTLVLMDIRAVYRHFSSLVQQDSCAHTHTFNLTGYI
jgi:hypothetical protein